MYIVHILPSPAHHPTDISGDTTYVGAKKNRQHQGVPCIFHEKCMVMYQENELEATELDFEKR